jgi:hypothetical protein
MPDYSGVNPKVPPVCHRHSSTLTNSLCIVFNTPASISRGRTATGLGHSVCYPGLSDHSSSPGWQRPKGARPDHSLLPERDGHDEHGNVAIVASLLACGHDPSKLGRRRKMGWAIVIGSAVTVALIDHDATFDSRCPHSMQIRIVERSTLEPWKLHHNGNFRVAVAYC